MAADPQKTARAADSAALQDEMQELARKLLDLWQDHISALAQDPGLMAQALKLMAAYTPTPFPWPQPGMASTGGAGLAQFPAGFPFGGVAPTPAARPAPAAAASDAGDGAVGELRRRVAELEGRLAELERGKRAKPARKRAPGARARAPKGG